MQRWRCRGAFRNSFRRTRYLTSQLLLEPPPKSSQGRFLIFSCSTRLSRRGRCSRPWFETKKEVTLNLDFGKRKPRLASVYAFPSLCKCTLKAIKDHATMLGFGWEVSGVPLPQWIPRGPGWPSNNLSQTIFMAWQYHNMMHSGVRDAYALGFGR